MRVGIADTTFSRVDFASVALDILKDKKVEVERYTVPGFKDLPVAALKLCTDHKCDIVLAFGWVGKEDIDEQCAIQANNGLIQAELLAKKHILKVFFHEQESSDEKEQVRIATQRAQKHTLNALSLLKGKTELSLYAGKGLRQGNEDVGEIE